MQYERQQRRIGKSLWEGLDFYIENSPLFFADRINTPLLMMHNDNDGHVPWYQGIEYVGTFKSLQKPCWLLNYVNEPNWPPKSPNSLDFQRRRVQFFVHYLQGHPMTKCVEYGVTA